LVWRLQLVSAKELMSDKNIAATALLAVAPSAFSASASAEPHQTKKDSVMIAELLATYYQGINQKKGWEQPLAEDLSFESKGGHTNGKPAYIEVNNTFLRGVKAARQQRVLTDGDTGCVWMSYDLVSPKGSKTTLDVLEIWKMSGGHLSALTIYFDTAAFGAFMKQ
jgi:hypothetical protein